MVSLKKKLKNVILYWTDGFLMLNVKINPSLAQVGLERVDEVNPKSITTWIHLSGVDIYAL